MVDTEYFTVNNNNVRIYKIPDQLNQITAYPSVTSICGIETDMREWHKKEKNWKEIILYAATVGTYCHYRVQCDLAETWEVMSPPLEFSPDQQKAYKDWFTQFPYKKTERSIEEAIEKVMMLYTDWKTQYNPQHPYYIINGRIRRANIYPFEIKLRSKRFGYAGSVDWLTAIRNLKTKKLANTICDLKTNNYDSHKYDLQVFAYYYTFKENYPEIPIDDYRILNLPKDTENYSFIFSTLKEEERDLTNQWLSCIAEFYKNYADELPCLQKMKPQVLAELKKEGII